MFFKIKNPQPVVVILGGDTNAHLSRIARQLAGIHGQLDRLNESAQGDSLRSVVSVAESLLKALDLPRTKKTSAVVSVCAASLRRTINRVNDDGKNPGEQVA